MTKQVLSIEQMKKLSKLMPLKEKTDFIWWGKGEGTDPDRYKWKLHCSDTADANPQCDWIYPAYTLQDVLDLLPKQIGIEYIYELYVSAMSVSYVQFVGGEINDIMFEVPVDGNLVDAAYEMLLWCINQGIINPRKEEHP